MFIPNSEKSNADTYSKSSYHINKFENTTLSAKCIISILFFSTIIISSFTSCSTTKSNILKESSSVEKTATDSATTDKSAKAVEVEDKKTEDTSITVDLKKEPVEPEPVKSNEVKATKEETSPPVIKEVIKKAEPAQEKKVVTKPKQPVKKIATKSPVAGSQKNILDTNISNLKEHYKGDGQLFYGDLHESRKWRSRFFKNTTSANGEEGLPVAGDILEVIGDSPLKVREFWAPTPAIGLVNPGDKVKVIETDELGLRKVWIKFTSKLD